MRNPPGSPNQADVHPAKVPEKTVEVKIKGRWCPLLLHGLFPDQQWLKNSVHGKVNNDVSRHIDQ